MLPGFLNAHTGILRVRSFPGGHALRGEPHIQFGEAREALLAGGLPDAPPRVLHALLDAAFLPARGDIAEVGVEEIVRRHRRKPRIDDARLATSRHTVHRRFHIVVDAPAGYAAEPREAASVSIKQHLVALARIRHQPEGAGRAQLHVRELDLAPDPADGQVLLAPVELKSLAPLEAQRHIRRAGRDRTLVGSPPTDKLGDTAVAAFKALGLKLGVQAKGGATLLARPMCVGLHGLAQPGLMRIKLLGAGRTPVGHLAAGGLPQPTLDGVSRQTGAACDLADRQAVPKPQSPNFCVHRHGVHLVFLQG